MCGTLVKIKQWFRCFPLHKSFDQVGVWQISLDIEYINYKKTL